MNIIQNDFDMNEEFEGIEELSVEDAEKVGGGPLPFAIFALVSAAVGMAEISRDIEDAPRKGGNNKNRTGTWNRSDQRLKRDIRIEGDLPSFGIKAYSWAYKDTPDERFVGVMAQDLLARDDLRSAVFKFADGPFAGFYGVDYEKLGLSCLPVEAWDGDVASLVVQAPVEA